MEQRKYDQATARAIFEMLGMPESWVIRDDGVFVTDEFRLHSPRGGAFDWTPAYEMNWPGAPNPLIAPVLPIPFTANELAACMLDGAGSGIQEVLDRRVGYSLDDEALERFTLIEGWVRDALRDAYELAAKAQIQVGEFDYCEEQKSRALMLQAADANNRANKREGVFIKGISRKKATTRRKRAIASVANLKAQAQQSHAAVNAKWFAWRKAMVGQLLRPQAETVKAAPEIQYQARPQGYTKVLGTTRNHAATVVEAPASETTEQRRARWLEWYGKGERGAKQRVYERELRLNPRADRSTIGKQIEIAKSERETKKRSGEWVSQLVKNGKR